MGLPGHRRTKSHKRRRASHFALKPKTLGVCATCKAVVMPHRACTSCGSYKGRVIIDQTRATNRLLARAKTEKPHDHERDHGTKAPEKKSTEKKAIDAPVIKKPRAKTARKK